MANANNNDIDALLDILQDYPCYARHHAALTTLVAERNALKEENIALRSRQKSHQDEVLDRVFEMDALRKRIAELEAHPPANRDLHERLVCAALTGILANYESRNHGADDVAEWAVLQADATLAAMRKGESHGK